MKKLIFCLLLFLLSACGGGGETAAPKVSRAGDHVVQGISYNQFRDRYRGDDLKTVQKRFIMLDRDNNGALSESEYNGY